MAPSFWSRNGFEESRIGWYQFGEDVSYELSKNMAEINELNPLRIRHYMTLSFTYTFQKENDEVFCAYTVPYSYSSLLTHLKQLKLLVNKEKFDFIRFESLGLSLGGIDVPLLKISNKNDDTEVYDDKPIIVVIGRQHPGETHSSFIIHGLVNYLLSRDSLCHKFRDRYETWVIPCVNPDGVVTGNYRSNLQGKDMNRNFYSDEDKDCKQRVFEVEMLRALLKSKFPAA
jgi:murein tripeptide amidase MpaA